MGNGFRVIGFSSHRVPEGATQGELEKLSLSQYRPALFAGVLWQIRNCALKLIIYTAKIKNVTKVKYQIKIKSLNGLNKKNVLSRPRGNDSYGTDKSSQ